MAADKSEKVDATLTGKKLQIDNEGNTYVYNRAMRRKKTRRQRYMIEDYVNVPDNMYTKKTAKIKKIRSKNAKTEQQRKRDAARARKAYKESYTQVS